MGDVVNQVKVGTPKASPPTAIRSAGTISIKQTDNVLECPRPPRRCGGSKQRPTAVRPLQTYPAVALVPAQAHVHCVRTGRAQEAWDRRPHPAGPIPSPVDVRSRTCIVVAISTLIQYS